MVTALDNESKRTRAIILLALRLGLRDCDICNLTFQEIDWQHDRIKLIQKKTGKPLVLPLLPEVGNALMDYILHERPKRDDHYPYIFLREQAPYNKLASVYSTCSKLLTRMKIKPVNGTATGVHIFRYSMVHNLLAAKVPHQVITDTLGHTSKESVRIPDLLMERDEATENKMGIGKLLAKYSNYKLLLLDEWLLNDYSDEELHFLFELIERRYDG